VKILIDMNLTPEWAAVLARHGHSCVHWSEIGDPRAEDPVLMEWAAREGYVVLTHDLDFGSLLALTHASGPSVLQIRTQDVLPSGLEPLLAEVLGRYEQELASGALIVVDEARSRVRILPLTSR
jgi:predicted nuclease of predicted toxin-antitoxin system